MKTVWKDRTTGKTGCGQPTAHADAWVEAMNKKFPGLHHWAVAETPAIPPPTPAP